MGTRRGEGGRRGEEDIHALFELPRGHGPVFLASIPRLGRASLCPSPPRLSLGASLQDDENGSSNAPQRLVTRRGRLDPDHIPHSAFVLLRSNNGTCPLRREPKVFARDSCIGRQSRVHRDPAAKGGKRRAHALLWTLWIPEQAGPTGSRLPRALESARRVPPIPPPTLDRTLHAGVAEATASRRAQSPGGPESKGTGSRGPGTLRRTFPASAPNPDGQSTRRPDHGPRRRRCSLDGRVGASGRTLRFRPRPRHFPRTTRLWKVDAILRGKNHPSNHCRTAVRTYDMPHHDHTQDPSWYYCFRKIKNK